MIGGMSVAAKTESDPASCYETPAWIVDRIHAAFGHRLDLDPCTTPDNPVGALRFIAPPDDGIMLPWHGETIFINPPYGRTIAHWTDKAIAASGGRQIILLIPARTCAAWFHRLARASTAIIFLAGRVRFNTGAKSDNAPFPSALVGLNHDLAPLADLGWRMTSASPPQQKLQKARTTE